MWGTLEVPVVAMGLGQEWVGADVSLVEVVAYEVILVASGWGIFFILLCQ